jgi:hypothetical protein
MVCKIKVTTDEKQVYSGEQRSIEDCHYKGAKIYCLYLNNNEDSQLFLESLRLVEALKYMKITILFFWRFIRNIN